ncbi:MAG TPA: ACP S-malonyltransferase [Bacillota bacterium]|nr:ACP S-malonyltransferase [Bacillota bacterium]
MEKIACLFPGQGSQYTGMGQKLYTEFPIARQTFEEANDVLGFDLQNLCFNGSLLELNQTENMLCAILTCSVAAFRVYMKEIGVAPQYLAGHSLGEYTALTCSEALRFEDALKIVTFRSRLAQKAADESGGILAIVNDIAIGAVEEQCRGISGESRFVAVAGYNSPTQAIVAGHQDGITALQDILMEMGGQVTPLFTSPPFHCTLMQGAADALTLELAKYNFSVPRWTVISNLDALPYTGSAQIRHHLSEQMVHPVQWQATIKYLEQQGVTIAIEIGSRAVLTNLVSANTERMEAFSFGQQDDRQFLLECLAGRGKNPGQTGFLTRCLAISDCTKNRNWNEAEYQKGVEEPYERIEQLQNQLELTGQNPTEEQMKLAAEMLRSILVTKKTPEGELRARFRELFAATGTTALFTGFLPPEP